MRKIFSLLISLLCTVTALVAVTTVIAPPAHAACSSFTNVKSASKEVPYGTANADWRVYVWLWWRHCDAGLIAEKYRVEFVPYNEGNCFRIDEWRVNPNVIGNYNPGTRHINCDGDDDKSATWDLYGEFVPNGSDASVRCLGANVTVGIIGANDENFALPSLCLPLT